jgi:hypothetical protein
MLEILYSLALWLRRGTVAGVVVLLPFWFLTLGGLALLDLLGLDRDGPGMLVAFIPTIAIYAAYINGIQHPPEWLEGIFNWVWPRW